MTSQPRKKTGQETVVHPVKELSLLRKPVKILVTGAEGAGKTKLTLVWDSGQRGASPETIRSPAAEDRDLRIVGKRTRWWRPRPKRFVTLTVPPGQIANESRKAVFDTYTVPGRRPDGVINVVCWGYNTPWRGADAADVRAAITRARAAAEESRRAAEQVRLAQVERRRAQEDRRRARDQLRQSRDRALPAGATRGARRRRSGRGDGEPPAHRGGDRTGITRSGWVRLRRRRMAQYGPSSAPFVTQQPRPASATGVEVTPADVIAQLRAINLEKELDDFRLVSALLVRAWARRSRAGEQFWLVIALAKCDLYDVASARRYYLPDDADEPTEFGRILADLRADVPTLRVVVCPVSAGPEPYGRKLNLGLVVEPVLRPDESVAILNRFWATVEDLCGIA